MADDTVNLRGSGGSIFTFDLPLRPNYVEQVSKGHLQPASPEDSQKLEGPVEEETQATPATNDPKAVWVEYADSLGIDTGDMTKQEVMDAVEAHEG